MSLATETLDRICNGEINFASIYTVAVTNPEVGSQPYMSVLTNKLFDDLTQWQRIAYSDTSDKYPILNIWNQTWMFVTELELWVIVGDRSSFLWSQVKPKEGYILDIKNAQLYKAV
jgi:hypothetical protein